jgi:hypothetical protein
MMCHFSVCKTLTSSSTSMTALPGVFPATTRPDSVSVTDPVLDEGSTLYLISPSVSRFVLS